MFLKLIKNSEAQKALGVGNTTFHELVKAGLMTPAVKLGIHSVARPEHEIQAIAAARIAGQSDDEIKALVKQLIEHRKKLPAIVQTMLLHHQPVEAASLAHEAVPCLSRGPGDSANIEKGGS